MNGRTLHVLLVEDSADDAELVAAELRRAGFDPRWERVETEPDFMAALEGRDPPDIILSDFSMPQFNGLQAVDLVRSRGLDIPFILVSGTLGEEAAVEAMKRGCTDYLLKDRLARLGHAVERALEQARSAEDRRRLQRQLLLQSTALETAANSIMVTDPKGTILWVNAAFTALTGYSAEEVLGKTPRLLKSGKHDQAFYRELWTTILSGQTWRGEFINRRKDGGHYHAEQTITPVRSEAGTITHFIGIMSDISERIHAGYRLATHHAVTRVLAEANTLPAASKQILQIVGRNLQWDVGALWMADRTTRRLRCVEIWHPPSTEFNDFVNFSRQTSFAPGQGLPGRVYQSGQPVWIADVAGESNLTREPMLTRLGLNSAIAFPIRLGDRIHGVLEFFSARIRPPDNELLSMFGTVGSQIGQFVEGRKIEEQLRQSQKMEAFGQLAGGVAHDFNNILAVIMGYAHLLLESNQLDAEAKDYLKEVYVAGERAANLTRQLLTFSRNKEMEVRAINLNDLIANMTKMLGRLVREDVRLECHFATGLPMVQADEGMMEQVLMNLTVNARDAMPKGGRLIIGTEQGTIDAASAQASFEGRAGEFVLLTVEDTGCGMTPEIKARIFEPFFTTKEVGKGTGLGLATVFGIVKQHQGWIEVDSQIGVGTTFKIFLPAIPRAEASRAELEAGDLARGGDETILLVEDEESLRGLTRLVLQRQGYEVLEAASGVEALEVWEHHGDRIDLLLTDMIMPDGLTGRELAKQLQARKPELKVIYASGYSAELAGTTFRVREASTFLEKPYHPQKLTRLVRQRLDE